VLLFSLATAIEKGGEVSGYMKIPDAAQRLELSEKTVRRHVKSGELPSVFIGGMYRISEEGLEAFIESRRVEGPLALGRASLDSPGRADLENQFYGKFRDYRLAAERTEPTATYWEDRLERGDLTAQDLRELGRHAGAITFPLEEAFGAEMRDLVEQHGKERELYKRSLIWPVLERWGGVVFKMMRLNPADMPDPDPEFEKALRELQDELRQTSANA
jgi:excisionase family DNA binding protein